MHIQEMAEAEEDGRKRRRLPKGTSEYQVWWLHHPCRLLALSERAALNPRWVDIGS